MLAEGVLADDHRLDLELRDELQGVDRREVRRVRHRDGEHPTHAPERQDEHASSGHVRGHELDDLGVDRDLREVDRRHAVLLGEHPREFFLRDEAQVHEGIPDPR